MANLKYKEPNSVLAALQLVGDVTLAASAQQYGGFTLAELDKVLVPYVKKSLHNYKEQARKYNITDEGYPLDCVKRELSQGFQSLEMKLNSIPSSRGDFSFSTVTFGNLDTDNLCDKTLQYYVCEAILNQRINGENVVFPKLVMLYSEEQNEKCSLQQKLFDKAIECSCKNLYPDYLAIDTVGDVSDLYRETGKVVSPMG